ncbi:MAG: SDR family NAD(P)-dependent oxidoreductase [SAR202 cluster bacterium]|jgi:NAD(P)-dependent dehydrogenase (short-subunit alcohol dehydrogenase family)|nr:SDR family NAD(P)-dependent oxidoreductase [SAR202 cluster bacterium]MDP6302358.1 SDR family NAD(P)-dependent oxidoreductase [SAR202 cluster bacterium]MDP7103694.1 SDR family NAD(P)-dependent oxidoreductase [SAR202 cluster bacterium]MDP7225212.1 SDR family NAD(P)-dependent oxidoreductase [SAR202 cluster bacterium]MDP7412565.1 SDR family NAD(P)-dependent oxidoreductase [SAR202 cluster bacterium]
MDRRESLRLNGRVAIVSGAGTHGGQGVGNGAATAILMAREGARLVLVDAVAEWVDATKATIESEGGEAVSVVADVTNADDCQRAVDKAVETYGVVHLLHNNVGGGSVRGNVVEATEEDWQRSASVNLMSMIHMSRFSVPHMKAAGAGSITNVSSVTALRPKAGASSAPYTVNKAAVVGLTQAMALDHAADNIRVNCIMPGLMWTPRVASGAGARRETRQTSTPLPTEGEGWDIAWAAVFLASDEARFVTGVVLPVDGGFLLTSAPN